MTMPQPTLQPRMVAGAVPPEHQLAAALMAAVDALEQTRRALIDQLQARIRAYVDEYATSGAGQTSVTVQAQTTNLELIRFILVQLPTGTTSATLTLPGPNGPRVIPLQNTTVALGPMSLLVPSGPRVLTYAPAGAAYLELMGEQIPTAGVL